MPSPVTHIVASTPGQAQRWMRDEGVRRTVVLVSTPDQLRGVPYDRIEFLSWPLHWTRRQVELAREVMEIARSGMR